MPKRHPNAPVRGSRSTAADDEDTFVTGVFQASTWARANQNVLIGFGVVLVLVLVGAIYYSNSRSRFVNEAVVQLEEIQSTVAVADTEATKVALAQYLEEFGGTPYAAEAALLLAQVYLDDGQPAQAISTLESSGIRLGGPLGAQRYTLEARAYESQGEWSPAEARYLEVAEGARMTFERHQALADAARMRARAGNHAGAADLYQRIVDDLEEADPERGQYLMRLAEARERAR